MYMCPDLLRLFRVLSQLLIENSTIMGGYASRLGGAVSFGSSGTLDIRSCNITKNSAPAGGGLFVQENATVSITNSRIEGNRATADDENSEAGNGGGLYVIHKANVSRCKLGRHSMCSLFGELQIQFS